MFSGQNLDPDLWIYSESVVLEVQRMNLEFLFERNDDDDNDDDI